MLNNKLTLAVAGSGKTESIVRECVGLPTNERVLVLTYTTNNQSELSRRLRSASGKHTSIEVSGWFSFLLGRFVRPFLPYLFPGKRVRGFDFKSDPQTYEKNDSHRRYFNQHDHARKVHLAQLVIRVEEASRGAGVRTLERLYDRVYIDEVQDLGGYDLEVLKLLMGSKLPITMVGDVRQAVLTTNSRERKNKKYMYLGIWEWFREREREGAMSILQQCETRRCRPEIASFADRLFGERFAFEATISKNWNATAHDGVFLVCEKDVGPYINRFAPLHLRQSKSSWKKESYDFLNFKISKGLSRERVLIWPTKKILEYITKGAALDGNLAAELYVAVTRAEQSVGFVVPKVGDYSLPFWYPAV
jgi:hypothetical protein